MIPVPKIGQKLIKHTRVEKYPGKDSLGIHKEYRVVGGENDEMERTIQFQSGPIKEAGVNGVNIEDLIVICIDQLQQFQDGDFSCRENAIAITKLEEAALWLTKRTLDRIERGVEGKNEK